MALLKSRVRINVKGGGTFKMRQISPTPSDPYVDYGYLTSLEFNDSRSMVESSDAEGNMVNANPGARAVSFVMQLKQTSKEEIDAVVALENVYVDCIYHVPLAESTKHQHLSMPCVKFNPSVRLVYASATERVIELTGYALAPKAAFTRSPVNYNVVANVPYVFLDDTTAIQDPVDTATNLAAAIM